MRKQIQIPVEALTVLKWQDGIDKIKPFVESLGYEFISIDHYWWGARIFYVTVEDNE